MHRLNKHWAQQAQAQLVRSAHAAKVPCTLLCTQQQERLGITMGLDKHDTCKVDFCWQPAASSQQPAAPAPLPALPPPSLRPALPYHPPKPLKDLEECRLSQ